MSAVHGAPNVQSGNNQDNSFSGYSFDGAYFASSGSLTADRAAVLGGHPRQRRVQLRQLPVVPHQHLQRGQLLGRRGVCGILDRRLGELLTGRVGIPVPRSANWRLSRRRPGPGPGGSRRLGRNHVALVARHEWTSLVWARPLGRGALMNVNPVPCIADVLLLPGTRVGNHDFGS